MNGPPCADGLECIYDGITLAQSSMAVCVKPGCGGNGDGVEDCPPWGDETVTNISRSCQQVQELGELVCHVDCDADNQCPTGMVCHLGHEDVCMWPKQ
jgi:hypothetical protein